MNKGINKKYTHLYPLLMIPFSFGFYLFLNHSVRNIILPYIVKVLGSLHISVNILYTVYAFWMIIVLFSLVLFCFLTRQIRIIHLKPKNMLMGMKMGWYVWVYSFVCILVSHQNSHGIHKLSSIISAVIYYILVAVCEEVVFRGLIQHNAYNYLKYRSHNNIVCAYSSVLVSSLLFALIHLSNAPAVSRKALLIQIAGAFIYGLLFGIITYKTDSVQSAIVLHAVNDIASAYAVIILKTGKTAADVINGYGLMDIIALLPVAVYLSYLGLKSQKCI